MSNTQRPQQGFSYTLTNQLTVKIVNAYPLRGNFHHHHIGSIHDHEGGSARITGITIRKLAQG